VGGANVCYLFPMAQEEVRRSLPLVYLPSLCYTGANMKRIEHFIPGIQGEQEGIVPHLRRPIPAGVAEAYVAACTEPGERVLVPYCQGSAGVREILSAGRQPLALHFDPLLALLVRAELLPPLARDLDAAVARLGDSPKQGMPLRHYLSQLYATTCPACARQAVAGYFIWDKEQDQPIAKYLRCPACGWDGQTAIIPEDWDRLEGIPVEGMHYHYILDRITPPQPERALRARLEFLLGLYSPRNLYALAELTLKIEGLFPEGSLQQALKLLLLDCLDQCSSLTPLPENRSRRRSLARPGRFLERNVWQVFEEAAVRLQALASKPLSGLSDTLSTFVSPDGEWAGFVGQGFVRDLTRALPPRSLRLILISPPPLDFAVWSLSYLWAAWLFGAEDAEPLRPLLRQRTPDPDWYARVMAGSLRALGGLLRDDGRVILILTDQRPALVEALVLAASQARLGVDSLVQCGRDYRLELVATFPQATPSEGALDAQIRRAAIASAVETIRARGEPVPWVTLHAAILQRLSRAGLLAQAAEPGTAEPSPLALVAEQVGVALEDPILVRMTTTESREALWWLAQPAAAAQPLSDRVETVASDVLQEALALTEADYAAKVYARFPGVLTPAGELVAACLRSYGREPTPGYWQLRQEDLPGNREAEREEIMGHLLALGRRLGYQAEAWAPFDVAWLEGQQPRAVFSVRWHAIVSESLALTEQAAGARPYLVIPGGRAALVSYKLAHNPAWQQAVDAAGWWFIKYRHVRELVGQPEVDEYILRTIVGLDPIVEREAGQLPLF
jgi:hypothetical protein